MKNRAKIFSIGGATFDIFVQPADQKIMTLETPEAREKYLCLEHGGKVQIKQVIETFGGGGTNTSIAFSRMGFDASYVGMIGSEYGDRVIANLLDNGVDTKYVAETKRDKTAFSNIINTFDGDRTVLAYAGANQYFSAKDLPMDELAEADWIFLNHLASDNTDVPAALIKLLKANPKIKLAWNPGHEQLTQGLKKWSNLLAHTEILFVNKHEASLFARMKYTPADSKSDFPNCHIHDVKKFLPPYAADVSGIMLEILKYGVKNVVITDGVKGAQATDGKSVYFCPVTSKSRVDTLGAGDAFASGFTSALVTGKNLKTALIYGSLNAHSVVNTYGAQAGLLTISELNKAFQATHLCVTSTRLMD
jgi:sugar/nucleoside kinase (ribokinase family)